MYLYSAAFLAASLSFHQVTATGGTYRGGWGGRAYYSTPDTTDNKCSTNQTNGYDWSDLSTGSFSSYGSNKFSGWTCANSFGKRDSLTKRTFQSKCITGKLDDEPAVDCDGDDKMSIKTYQVSSDQDDDVDIECHYTMPDNSVCKEVHTCASSGSTIENTQCGGAKKVTFKPYGKSKGKGCNIGVHSIEFDCKTASLPPSYSTAPASSNTQPPAYGSTSAPSSAATTSVPGYGSSSSETPPRYPTSESVPSYPTSSAEGVPGYSTTSSVETSPVEPSTPIYSIPPSYGNSSTVKVPGYGASSTYTSEPPVEAPTTYPQPESPDVLPKCINSWLHLTACSGNTDYECFCKNSDFVGKVYSCVSAWSDSDDDTNSGAGYFMGICAKYVPENPAIITGCPSTITPATGYHPPTSTPESPMSEQPPVSSGGKTATEYSTIIATITSCGPEVKDCPAASTHLQTSTQPIATSVESSPTETGDSKPPPAVPCTTITYSSELVIPATYSTGESQGATIPSSSCTTQYITTVTVPQVQITTYTVTESGSTQDVPGLGYETPAPAPSPTASSPAGYSSAPPPASYPITTASGPAPSVPVYTGGSSSLGTTYVPVQPTGHIPQPYTGGAGQTFARSTFLVSLVLVAFAGVVMF